MAPVHRNVNSGEHGRKAATLSHFRLPRQSGTQPGKLHARPGARQPRTVQIYRWLPDDEDNPCIDSYEMDAAACESMMLVDLFKIKNQIDSILNLRLSRRECVS
jgi:succinate dehydrogenase / fumarate reductase iron-sulfur subunit